MLWPTTPPGTLAIAMVLALLLATVPAWAQPQVVPPQPLVAAPEPPPCVPVPRPARNVADHPHGELFRPTGNPDRDFALMMRAHHQEGVDMANLEIANGKSTKLKAIARRIVKDQQQEIAELDKWTARHNLRLSRAK
jgi:hypothetical protein